MQNNIVDEFIEKGFIRVDNAFPKSLAREVTEILWRDTGCTRDDLSTWTRPVVWLGEYVQEPFVAVANTEILHAAFDLLIGHGNWKPRRSLGTFPVRFPVNRDSGDIGLHVDASFPGEDIHDFLSWRINVYAQGRALLMLLLFSDIRYRI
jgi:hypothetical protein